MIAENNGYIIAPMIVRPVNEHDNILFPESLEKLLETAYYFDLDIKNSHFTLDSGFDDKKNEFNIQCNGLIPVIKPNSRGTKDREKIYARLDNFNEKIYKERYKIERTFAWEDTYRKLVIRYEKLQCLFSGFRYLAYSMINLREFFQQNCINLI